MIKPFLYSAAVIFITGMAMLLGSCKKGDTTIPVLNIQEVVSVTEGNGTPAKAVVLVSLSAASDELITFRWSTTNGDAIANVDYTAYEDVTMVLNPGETSKQIEIEITNDDIFEPDEYFTVSIVYVRNATLGNSQCKVIILNDDIYIPQLIMPISLSVLEGNQAEKILTFNVKLSGATTSVVSLKWSTIDGTAKAGEDYVLKIDQPLIFSPGETEKFLDLSIIGDEVFEMDDTFYISLAELQGCLPPENQTSVTIINDDTFYPTLIEDGYITPMSYQWMELVWNDEFDGTAINTENWTFETGGGGWGNNEWQVYTTSSVNSNLTDGKLNIIATKQYNNYFSARLKTQGKKEFRYGRIDIRAKMPFGKGIWPALWMLGSNFGQVGWPRCGEIDIMEYIGHQQSTTYGTAHYFDGGHLYSGGDYTLSGGQSFHDMFHVFSIVWQENSIKWYVDYQQFYEVKPTNIVFDAFRLNHFFIFNLAVGGNWPGYPNETTQFPQMLSVDYVRVFQ